MSLLGRARDKLFSKLDGKAPEEAIASVEEQPEEAKRLCDWVKSRIEESRNASNRIACEGIWMTNVAYLVGVDSVFYDTATRQYRPISNNTPYPRRNRITSNKILPAAQNRLARLCKVPPRFEVRPNSTQPEDKDAARLGLEVLAQIWEEQEVNRKRINLMMWVQECGHAYLHVSHDPNAGEPLYDPIEGTEVGSEGRVRIDVGSAFEYFPDPLAKSFDEIMWIARAKVRRLDYFVTRYGKKGELVKPEGAWLLSVQYEARINSLNTTGLTGTASPIETEMQNSAIEMVYYEKPSSLHKGGRMIVVANGVLLEEKPLPVGEIPIVKFDDIVVAGKYYPEAVITHARPLQQQYNLVLSKRAEWDKKLIAGKYISEKRHGLIDEAINDRSGEVVQYNHIPGVPEPKAMTIPVMPSYVMEESDFYDREINTIFGLSEVSQGKLPAAGIPAIGMQLLVEQDETRIGIEVEQHEHAFAQLGRLCLRHVAKLYKTPRKLKQKNRSGEYTVRDFTGDDLKGNLDVTVVRGSTVPTSRALKRQEILNAYGQGLLGDPNDPAVREKVLGSLEFGDIAEVWRDRALDMNQIKDSIDEMEKGIVPEISEFDNHRMHFQEKNAFRKTDRFKGWQKPLKALLEDDMNRHLDLMVSMKNPGVDQKIVQAEAAANVPDDLAPVEEMPDNMGEPAFGEASPVEETPDA